MDASTPTPPPQPSRLRFTAYEREIIGILNGEISRLSKTPHVLEWCAVDGDEWAAVIRDPAPVGPSEVDELSGLAVTVQLTHDVGRRFVVLDPASNVVAAGDALLEVHAATLGSAVVQRRIRALAAQKRLGGFASKAAAAEAQAAKATNAARIALARTQRVMEESLCPPMEQPEGDRHD
jgi:hypothetical protein